VYVCMRATKVLWLLHLHLEALERRPLVENTLIDNKNIPIW
jgi:hypothetical protein